MFLPLCYMKVGYKMLNKKGTTVPLRPYKVMILSLCYIVLSTCNFNKVKFCFNSMAAILDIMSVFS